jgi:hypothetical protein
MKSLKIFKTIVLKYELRLLGHGNLILFKSSHENERQIETGMNYSSF